MALAEQVRTPFGTARLQQLLFERKVGNGRERATVAAQAYLACAERWTGPSSHDDLQTALALARAVKNRDLHARITTRVLDIAERSLADGSRPGGAVIELELLVDEADVPGRYDELLRAATSHGLNVRLTDRVQIIRRARASTPDARLEIDRERVNAWSKAAGLLDGLVRMSLLSTALTIAERSGDPALTNQAAAALQASTDVAEELREFAAWTVLSDEDRQNYLRPITEATGWREALDYFSILGPITGSPDANRRQADDNAKIYISGQLFPKQILGPDHLPMYAAIDEASKADIELTELETYALQGYGPVLAMALIRIRDQHGMPDSEELVEYLTRRPLVDAAFAAAIGRSLHRYWTGDPEGAAFTAAPRIETAARNLILASNAGIYRLQRENRPGQYPGLGFFSHPYAITASPNSGTDSSTQSPPTPPATTSATTSDTDSSTTPDGRKQRC